MIKIIFSFFLLFSISCTTLRKPKGLDHHTHHLSNDTSLPEAYLIAVKNCKESKNPEIRTLRAVKPGNKDLIWKKFRTDGKEELRVLVVTWTSEAAYFPKPGESSREEYEVWVTAAPEVKNVATKARKSNIDVDERLEQYLGLPPNSGHKYFVELWIRPEDLFRPAADPEIDDHEAKYKFSNVRYMLKTSCDYKTWYRQSAKSRYYPDSGDQPYPLDQAWVHL